MIKEFKILAVGDVVGRAGRDILASKLQGLVDAGRIDMVVVNGENAAGGWSITPEIYRDFTGLGIHVVTMGNHVWDNKDVLSIIDSEEKLVRPANLPPGVPGKGFCFHSVKGTSVCVINLMGRTHMQPIDCPFRKFDSVYEEVRERADVIVVDFHAETTSEKRAFGWYVDGRANIVFGTHTHVQTADEEIFPGGTGYITDLGMTGAFDSVIGMGKETSIRRFLYGTRERFEAAAGNPRINGAVFTIGEDRRVSAIRRINE